MSFALEDAGYWNSPEQCDAANEIVTLRKQVEMLTKERDEAVAAVQRLADGQPFDAIVIADTVKRQTKRLEQQLAALAEQNEKMREALQKLACLGNGEQYGNSIGNCIAQEALSLPDLTSPVLNRIRAEGMREAINLYSPDDSAQDWIDKISARADELEKTND